MRLNIARTVGSLLLAGILLPAGMLMAIETHSPLAATSNSANWYDTEEATNLLNQMQTLAFKVRMRVAPLQAQDSLITWRAQSAMLLRASNEIDKIGSDWQRLDQIKKGLEPWQQDLVDRAAPEIHEMVFQTNAAIRELKAHEDRTALAMTGYPHNIDEIYQSGNQMAKMIGDVTQYIHAEQKVAALNLQADSAGS